MLSEQLLKPLTSPILKDFIGYIFILLFTGYSYLINTAFSGKKTLIAL